MTCRFLAKKVGLAPAYVTVTLLFYSIYLSIMKNIFLILVVTFLFTACSDSSPTMRALDNNATILAFGDSLTEGYGVTDIESYPAILEDISGLTVINAGVSGEISENGLRRLPGLLETHRPKLVIICHGGNDILRKQSMNAMKSNVLKMINLSREAGADVILLGVPKPGLFLSSYEAYVQIAEQTDVVFLEEVIPDVLGDNDLKSDTVHPNAKGYQVMAETIYDTLKSQGAL